jgi:hypothetical protein
MASENWGSQGNELEVGDFLEKWVLAQSVSAAYFQMLTCIVIFNWEWNRIRMGLQKISGAH